jgi:hypothetical protein
MKLNKGQKVEGVYLYAYKVKDGSSSPVEEGETPTGWCVYTRIEPGTPLEVGIRPSDFDLVDEKYYRGAKKEQQAREFAEALALKLGVELNEY